MAWVVTGIIAASAAYMGYESYKSRKLAENQAEAQTRDAAKVRKEEEKNKNQAAMRNIKRKGATSDTSDKARSTILTGSMGIPNEPAVANKQLLGL